MNDDINKNTEPLNDNFADDGLAPLDTFESAWTSQLASPERDLEASADAFVVATLARHERSDAPVASDGLGVLARIGWMPLAAAAAIALAGAVGFAVMQQGTSPQGQVITDNGGGPTVEPEKIVTPAVATREDAQRLQLGALIGQASGSFTQPTASLPKTIEDTTGRLTLRSLVKDLANPIPDPKDFLPPREAGEGNS